MATAAHSSRSAQSYNHHGQYRHHPYAPPAASSSTASSSSSSRPKWQSANEPRLHQQQQQPQEQRVEPPSPPRSRRDSSASPPVGLGVAFGGASGGKWWDEELPAPPSSLSSILDSFRRSGEGDRELLLSILGAKKAEEERLTALIQTRLTVLQARLSIHSAAAQMSYSPLTPPSEGPTTKDLPIIPERTPSLGGSSRASASSGGPVSPIGTYMPPPPVPAQLASEKATRGYFTLPPPQSMLRHRSRSRSPVGHRDQHVPPMRIGDRDVRDAHARSYTPRGSTSPKSTGSEGRAPGLDMLLDAGMERERRDSGERK